MWRLRAGGGPCVAGCIAVGQTVKTSKQRLGRDRREVREETWCRCRSGAAVADGRPLAGRQLAAGSHVVSIGGCSSAGLLPLEVAAEDEAGVGRRDPCAPLWSRKARRATTGRAELPDWLDTTACCIAGSGSSYIAAGIGREAVELSCVCCWAAVAAAVAAARGDSGSGAAPTVALLTTEDGR